MATRVLFSVAAMGLFFLSSCGAVGHSDEANTMQCGTDFVDGVDVYDGNGAIDWPTLKASGRDFAFIKATQGDYFNAKTFAYNWSAARSAGVIRSAYHFFDPTVDGVAQAQSFLAAMGTLDADDLAPMLDIECPVDADESTAQSSGGSCEHSGDSGWVAPATITARIFDWLTTVEAATGRTPILYSYPSWFADVMQTDARFAAYPLYIATYSSCASVPSPWQSAVFWQDSATATVPGISGEVDTDRYFGTLAQLQAFAAAPTVTPTDGGSTISDGRTAPEDQQSATTDSAAPHADFAAAPVDARANEDAATRTVTDGASVGEPDLSTGRATQGGCSCEITAGAPRSPAGASTLFAAFFSSFLLLRRRPRRA